MQLLYIIMLICLKDEYVCFILKTASVLYTCCQNLSTNQQVSVNWFMIRELWVPCNVNIQLLVASDPAGKPMLSKSNPNIPGIVPQRLHVLATQSCSCIHAQFLFALYLFEHHWFNTKLMSFVHFILLRNRL